jgi:hypothetical protein
MGRAVKEDERPTSNIQRPTSNEKTNWEAGRPGSRGQGVGWVERSKKMNVQHRTSNVQHRMKKQTVKQGLIN